MTDWPRSWPLRWQARGLPVADRSVPEGAGTLRALEVGTATLVVTSVSAVALDALGVLHAVVSALLFGVGVVSFLAAFLSGLVRSRTEAVTLSGLFFLSGDSAPVSVRRRFQLALAIEVVAVVVAASVRPYSEVAFGILAPMYALGLAARWGARHGTFGPRSA